jgi:hypothetical protein
LKVEIMEPIDTSVVVETYNCLEGTSIRQLQTALQAVTGFRRSAGEIEVIVAEVTGDPDLRRWLRDAFPSVRLLDARALSYDGAKALAAREARGRYVVYLDCDCVPEPGWFEHITEPLRSGSAVVVGGFARYPGGLFSAVLTVLDFGFLLPRSDRPLGCYASNNSAFLRDVLLDRPEPSGPMRCLCYAHAQSLGRSGFPVRLAAKAGVLHARPPFLRERLRQGYDMVAACWVDSELRESRWLWLGPAAAPLFYRRAVKLDWRRLRKSFRDLNLRGWQVPLAALMPPCLRLLDLVGILAALVAGARARRLIEGRTH